MLCCKGDKPGKVCKEWATHVLVYINATTFREITDKPKAFCFHHAHGMQITMKAKHGILSRIYTVKEWKDRVERYRKEKQVKEKIKSY